METLSLGIIAWIIIGGLAGWIAGKIKDSSQGFFGNIIVGVVGGVLGGWLLSIIGVDVASGGFWFSLLTAVLGSVILLSLLNAIKK